MSRQLAMTYLAVLLLLLSACSDTEEFNAQGTAEFEKHKTSAFAQPLDLPSIHRTSGEWEAAQKGSGGGSLFDPHYENPTVFHSSFQWRDADVSNDYAELVPEASAQLVERGAEVRGCTAQPSVILTATDDGDEFEIVLEATEESLDQFVTVNATRGRNPLIQCWFLN